MSQTSQEDFNPCSSSGLSALHKTFVWTAIFFFSLLFINKGDFLVAVISAWKGKLYVKIKVSKIFHPEPQNIIPYLSKKIVPEFCDNQDLGMPLLLNLFCVVEFFPIILKLSKTVTPLWSDILSPKTQTKWGLLADSLIISSFHSTENLDQRPADTSSWNILSYKQVESSTAWSPKQFPELLQALPTSCREGSTQVNSQLSALPRPGSSSLP